MRSLDKSADRAAIVRRLELVQADDRGLWGVMNAAEMICHLRGAFRVAMGEIAVEPIPLSIPPAVLGSLALWVPMQWRKNFETVPALKRGTPVMQVGAFAADRAELLAELERFCGARRLGVLHAYFGRMSVGDWMRWGWLHCDHHLRQFGR